MLVGMREFFFFRGFSFASCHVTSQRCVRGRYRVPYVSGRGLAVVEAADLHDGVAPNLGLQNGKKMKYMRLDSEWLTVKIKLTVKTVKIFNFFFIFFIFIFLDHLAENYCKTQQFWICFCYFSILTM